MSLRAVYDTMVFLQWAALPTDRQHGTIKALYDGSVSLCISKALLDEVRDVLSRSDVIAKAPNITPARLIQVLDAIVELADWITDVPATFTWPQHPDDDHLFNLAIAAKAKYLVTWETRILKLGKETTPTANLLRQLAPGLSIVTPAELTAEIKR